MDQDEFERKPPAEPRKYIKVMRLKPCIRAYRCDRCGREVPIGGPRIVAYYDRRHFDILHDGCERYTDRPVIENERFNLDWREAGRIRKGEKNKPYY